MSGCDRFEREGLALLERDLPLDEHFENCPDCIAARETYARLRGMLNDSAPLETPREGWEARVRSTIVGEEAARIARADTAVEGLSQRAVAGQRRTAMSTDRQPGGRKRIRWLAAAAAIIAAAFLLPPGFRMLFQPTAEDPQLTFKIERGDRPSRRGEVPHPGDRLILQADTGAASHAELRVYRDDTELILRCSDSPPCVLRGTRLSATLVLEQLGIFQPLLITSEQPIPPPAGTLDEDAAAVLSRDGRFVLSEEIRVR